MFTSKKPFSAVSVQIDRMTSEQYEEDDLSGIIDLIEVIRIQSSGPTEAARAIRKKLKYGSPHRQIRALVLLDGLIQNAGGRFQRTFADEPLLERLRMMPRDDMVDAEVRKRADILFRQWAVAYKDTAGLSQIAHLSKQLPQTQRKAPTHYKVIRETEAEAAEHSDAPPSPIRATHARSSSGGNSYSQSSSSKPGALSPAPRMSTSKFSKGKKDKGVKFNLEREKTNMMQTIAQASVASTNLLNALQLINREHERVSENTECTNRFETCKALRRQILRYIQLVESDEWIGSLLSANDELVKALTSYEIIDKSIEDDSDSDAWETPEGSAASRIAAHKTITEEQLAGLHIGNDAPPPAKPARPSHINMPPPPARQPVKADDGEDEEDEDDPFGDSNEAKTPYNERPGMTWKTV